jgi:hypothetical protein
MLPCRSKVIDSIDGYGLASSSAGIPGSDATSIGGPIGSCGTAVAKRLIVMPSNDVVNNPASAAVGSTAQPLVHSMVGSPRSGSPFAVPLGQNTR